MLQLWWMWRRMTNQINKIGWDEALKIANNEIFFVKRRKNNLLLNDYQINVLNSCGINYCNYFSMKELLFAVLEYLNNNDNDELEFVSEQIDEYVYYVEVNK